MKAHFSVKSVFAVLMLFNIACSNQKKSLADKEFIISMNIASNPQTVNPLYYSSANDVYICRHLFQPLLAVNDSFDDYVPILAESLPKILNNEGKNIIRYKLKSDAKWDNGSSVSSIDVITTYKFIFNPHSELPYLSDYYSFIDSIIPINNLEFDIYINSNPSEAYFKTGDFEILPKYIFDESDLFKNYSIQDLKNYSPKNVDSLLLNHGRKLTSLKLLETGSKITGSGPYRIQEYNINQNVILSKKENWWGERFSNESHLFKSNPEKIKLNVYMDEMAAALDFSNNKLDVLFSTNQKTLNTIFENKDLDSRFTEQKYLLNGIVYLAINGRHFAFNDKRSRKAIAILSDPNTFVNKILSGQAEAISSAVSKNNKRLYNSKLKPIEMNLQSAESLLKEAGWKRKNSTWFYQNKEVRLDFLIQSGNKNSEDFGIFFKNNASKIGLRINLIPLEFATFISKIRNGDYAITRLGTNLGPMFDNYHALFHSSSIGQSNYPRLENLEIDSLLEKIELETDKESKRLMIWKLQELVYNEFNYVFLYSPLVKVYYNKNLKGFAINSESYKPWLPAFNLEE